MPNRVKVFIGHAEDAATDRLVTDLRTAGAKVWMDTAAIRGDDIARKIDEGRGGRQWPTLVLTPDVLRSPMVQANGPGQWSRPMVQAKVNAALNRSEQGLMDGVMPSLASPVTLATFRPCGVLRRYDATADYQSGPAGLLCARCSCRLPMTACQEVQAGACKPKGSLYLCLLQSALPSQ